MKRKDLYQYIRQEIINELSETTYAGKDSVQKIQKDPKFNTLKSDAKANAISDLKAGGDVELEEMARTPNNIKLGDPAKIALARKLYAGTWKEDLLNVVEKAGEEGISQLELAKAVGKSSQPAINPSVNEFLKIGAFALVKSSISPTVEPTPIEEPELELEPEIEPEKVEPADEDEEDVEVKDDWEKSEEEEEPAEEEPKTADIKADDKEIEKISGGSTYAQKLSSEDEEKYNKLKKGIENKVNKLSQMSKDNREASDDLKILKQLIARDDVKKLFKAKGVSLKDLTSSIF